MDLLRDGMFYLMSDASVWQIQLEEILRGSPAGVCSFRERRTPPLHRPPETPQFLRTRT